MSSRVPSYKSTLDRFIFVDVEVKFASYGILSKFLEHPLTKIYMQGLKARAILELHSNNAMRAILLEVKFKTTSYITII